MRSLLLLLVSLALMALTGCATTAAQVPDGHHPAAEAPAEAPAETAADAAPDAEKAACCGGCAGSKAAAETTEKAACSCKDGKAGGSTWCEACGVGYVKGEKAACKGCYAAKTGGDACTSCASE